MKPKQLQPDYYKSFHSYGGKLKDIPKPHIREFGPKSPLKREVQIEVSSWVWCGSIGAKHVYVKMRVDKNCIWNSKEGVWQAAWDDPDAEWKDEDKELETEFILKNGYDLQITKWVRRLAKKYFPSDKFEIKDPDYKVIEPKQWFYKSDGD